MGILEKREEKGRQEGIQKGRQEGIQKGRQEGIQKGRQEGIKEVAKNLLKEGMEITLIVKSTGLPKSEVERLKEEIN